MRYVLLFFLPMALIVGVLVMIQPARVVDSAARMFGHAMESVERITQAQEFRLKGLITLTEDEVRGMLPGDKSTLWWLLNLGQVEQIVRSNPFVSAARVRRCGESFFSEWGCFSIEVEERVPAFVALVEGLAWLVGADGGFIGPLPNKLNVSEFVREISPSVGRLRIIKGIAPNVLSPDLVKARFQYAREAMDILETESGIGIEWGELKENGELLVKFNQFELLATFAFNRAEWEVLRDEATRFKLLVKELGTRISLVKEVDLAFDTLAVMRFQ